MESPSLNSFDSPVNAVVQGASRGQGLAYVRHLLESPNVQKVLATSRNPDESEPLQQLVDESEGGLLTKPLDVTDEDQIADVAEFADGEFDEINLLLNVAGILHDETRGIYPEKKIEEVDPSSVEYVFEVNGLGPLLMIKHFAPMLRHDSRAVIGNISAKVGSITNNELGGWYAYRASKAAQNMFTKTASIELGRYRSSMGETICVALHPGTVETELSGPYHTSVPDDEVLSPEKATRQLLEVIDDLGPEDSGGFFDGTGRQIEW